MPYKRRGPSRTVGGKRRPQRRPVQGTTTVPRRNVRQARRKRPIVPPGAKVKKQVPQPIGPWVAAGEMLRHIRPAEITAFDVGAHYGNVTEHMLRIWKRAHVYAFDPEPEGIARLHGRFDGDDRVTIVPAALGRKCTMATFHVGGQGTEMSSLRPRPDDGRRYYRHELKKRIRVSVLTVDAFMQEESVDHVHFMKVDVQGGERDVIKGAAESLTGQKIDLVYMEVLFVDIYKGASLFHQLVAQMSRYGYELFDVYDLQRSWVNRQLKYRDALWVSPRIRETRLDTYPDDWLPRSVGYRMCPDR